ncbi:hypothetical protein [Enemella evansiae]|uniref:DUF4352 domain-containing protein n=1 Tax=Enemella evansiae TaxID=2016499 RepID=A0A255GKT3_9ACTN|nr:hypothetical protein [Enemella evansiae]OYO10420.1 hypothetical protein BI335_17995 [Enemella evansiae]OYO13594.1 hypothetical protein CGZ94_11570 [Enemella evansiae]TDO86346.1 hypothetical protein C8D81_3723 [Enemella evansiae]
MRRWVGFGVALLLAVATAVWVGMDNRAARPSVTRENTPIRAAGMGEWVRTDGIALRVVRADIAPSFPDADRPEKLVEPTAAGAVIVRVAYEVDRGAEQSVLCSTGLYAGLGGPDQREWSKSSLIGLTSFDDPSHCGWKPSDGSPRPPVITLVEGFEVPPGTSDLTFQLGRDAGTRVRVPLPG